MEPGAMKSLQPAVRARAPIVVTERLRLREFSRDDLDELAAMVADEQQMSFYERPKTRAEASTWIDRNLELYERCGFGFWAIEPSEAAGLAGYCGIRPVELDDASETEIGWHVHKLKWNQGIASEAAAAVTWLASERFGIGRVVALIPPDHLASRRVAEKIGLREERGTLFEGEQLVVYATPLVP
jgi:RimJ/RimL family protein N-acetyltransferase